MGAAVCEGLVMGKESAEWKIRRLSPETLDIGPVQVDQRFLPSSWVLGTGQSSEDLHQSFRCSKDNSSGSDQCQSKSESNGKQKMLTENQSIRRPRPYLCQNPIASAFRCSGRPSGRLQKPMPTSCRGERGTAQARSRRQPLPCPFHLPPLLLISSRRSRNAIRCFVGSGAEPKKI